MVIKKSIYNNLINSCDLKKIIKDKNTKIIDCRWFLNNPNKGYSDYLKSHIPSAIFFDIDKVSNNKIELPHMLPTYNTFNSYVNKSGINKNNVVIIYDQHGFFSSSRVWFIFKHYGFERVKILNGGFQAWKKLKYRISSIKIKTKYCRTFFSKNLQKYVVDKVQVKDSTKSDKNIIIDARPSNRFLGQVPEPRPFLRKGNILKSINVPFNKIYDLTGKLKGKTDLIKLFTNLSKNKEVICYCGSGVTACNLIFVLNLLNFTNIKLYDGSWAEWGKKE